MYVSKYFTCAEIDERLKQGYYDDFVSAGFVGSIQEFWDFVLSIKDKPGAEAVQGLIQDLDTKLQGIISQVRNDFEAGDTRLDQKIDQSVTDLEAKLEEQKVTKVSQLENDSNYQTEEQVKAFISALVNGADESLDTLLELAEALGNDPNFAATVTEKLGKLKEAIEQEAARAKEKEAELQEALSTETTKREEGDANVLKLTEAHIDRISASLQQSFDNLDQKITNLSDKFLALQGQFHDLSIEVNTKVEEAKTEAKADNDALKTELQGEISSAVSDLETKISDEENRATGVEADLDKRITELAKTHTDDLTTVTQSIADNKSAIQKEVSDRAAEDQKLDQKISDEAAARLTGDTTLQEKLAKESLDRLEGDTNLQSGLTQEIADRKTADSEIKVLINDEKTARETADADLSRDLDQLSIRHGNELSTLTQKLDAEIARAKTAEESKVEKVEGKGLSTNDFTTALLDKLNGIQDQANYITKVSELLNDSGFQTKVDVEAAIQKIIGAAPDTLDTLQEIAEALGKDPNFSTTILNRLASITTQLNEEIDNRKAADDTLKLELLAEIKKTSDSLGNSYTVLEERLNTYKTLSDSGDKALNDRVDALTTTLDSKVEFFLEKVTELSNKYTEKVTELNNKVNQFTTDILARLSAQDDLINGNAANIQRNLELIQGLTGEITGIKDTANKNLNQLLQAIRDEADVRKTNDDLLTTKVDANTQKLAATAESLEQLEQYIKDNPSTVKGSSTIEATPKENAEGFTDNVLSVIVPDTESILIKSSTGLQTKLGIKKTEVDHGITYHLTGKDGNPIPGVAPIEVPEANPFTEAESHDMYTTIYGEAFDPETADILTGLTGPEASALFNEVYS